MPSAHAHVDSFATNEDWAAAGIPLPPKNSNYGVEHVEVIGPLTLHVRHADGVKGTVRFEDSHLGGIFSPLRDPKFFEQTFVEFGAVRWPNDLDISPDNMHRHLFAFGEWVLR